MPMKIREILRSKGEAVATVPPDATVRELIAELARHNFGALVVSSDGVTIAGIVSERDVVRRLHDRGADLLTMRVADIMTAEVHTCAPGNDVESLRRTMTERRIRHVPVVEENRLVGLVSIGDVVKSAISELETERAHLVGYIHS
jgi:CBS domain-containing protein